MTLMRIVVLDFLSVNCYLLWNKDAKDAIIVDPGSCPEAIEEAVEEEKLAPKAVFLTHAHVDHISAVPQICKKYGIPVWLNQPDLCLYSSPHNALKPWMDAPEGLPEPVAECPNTGMDFKIIHTPGHTPGGACFYFPKDGFVLTGDTLFKGTYGRTDFPGGDEDAIFKSIREKLLTLDANVIVHPGHGPSTSIGKERSNPLFR